MARVLADGTGAAWSQVWLVVGDRPTLAATWPPDAARAPAAAEPAPTHDAAPGRRSLAGARTAGELLGVLVVQERPSTCRSPRSRSGCSPASPTQAGLVLRGARLRAELAARAAGAVRSGPTSCAAPAAAGRRPGRRSAGGWSATSTTAPSSTWSRSR